MLEIGQTCDKNEPDESLGSLMLKVKTYPLNLFLPNDVQATFRDQNLTDDSLE